MQKFSNYRVIGYNPHFENNEVHECNDKDLLNIQMG